MEALRRGSAAYAALGVGTIREAMITVDELLAYQDAAERGLLSVRVRPLIRIGNELSEAEALSLIRGLGARSGFGDDWLRLWGLKFVMDGGVEGGAPEQPYANDPANSGHLNWDPAVMTRVCTEAVRRGWRIGTHAVGDRAVRTVLDVYEAVAAQVGNLPPWTLVIEHALLSDAATRARAVRGGFGVTVQHPLLWNMGSEMLAAWGPERTSQVSPLDEWLAAGASLAAGTDIARPFNPMTAVWGMVTRGTKSAGIQGPAHAIDVATALELYTMGSARLNHEADRLGSHQPRQARRPGRLPRRPVHRGHRRPGRTRPAVHHRRRAPGSRPAPPARRAGGREMTRDRGRRGLLVLDSAHSRGRSVPAAVRPGHRALRQATARRDTRHRRAARRRRHPFR